MDRFAIPMYTRKSIYLSVNINEGIQPEVKEEKKAVASANECDSIIFDEQNKYILDIIKY